MKKSRHGTSAAAFRQVARVRRASQSPIADTTKAKFCAWYLGSWLARQERATALTVLVWPHVFRYVALQAYSAQRAGFPISDAGLRRLVYGDLAGCGARVRCDPSPATQSSRRSRPDLVACGHDRFRPGGEYFNGIHENLFGAATGVTWMIVSFYVPLLVVSITLTVWQLYSRFGEPIAASDSGTRMRMGGASAV
jgi:hypothetical protein